MKLQWKLNFGFGTTVALHWLNFSLSKVQTAIFNCIQKSHQTMMILHQLTICRVIHSFSSQHHIKYYISLKLHKLFWFRPTESRKELPSELKKNVFFDIFDNILVDTVMQRFLKMAAAADVNLDSAFYSATKSKQQFSIATRVMMVMVIMILRKDGMQIIRLVQ